MHSVEQLRRADAIFADALEKDAEERVLFLDLACAEQPSLRGVVDALLEADREAGAFLETSWCQHAAEETYQDRFEARVPSWAGPYRLLRRIGEGGMGTVFLAARADERYEKLVAVKLLLDTQPGSDVKRRFERERQVLAPLEHPNIARLYDAGETEFGMPYLVMEFVDGLPIDQYCDLQRLGISARVALLLTVCEAVEHAHRRLLIHRDLKPANLLVTKDGTPKLLDFGIAKMIAPEASAKITSAGRRGPMTPSHASPEQIMGLPLTTASDVYALGVLLYQLLTGDLPYKLEDSSPEQLIHRICHQTPEPPSRTVVGQKTVARKRQTTTRELGRQLAGDLDAIVAQALRKDPTERYASVAQLADDLHRHLTQQPVLARQGTWRYRTGRFIRRNRMLVAMATALILTFVIFSSALVLQVTHTEAERNKAERVAGFFTDLFSYADPETAQSHSVTLREVLDKGIARYRQGLDDQPEIQALIFHTAGAVYRQLGEFEIAESLVSEGLEIRRRVLGTDHPEVAESLMLLSAILMANRRNLDRAEQLRQEAVALYQKEYGRQSLQVADGLNALAWFPLARGDIAQAVQLRREALEIARREGGDGHPTSLQIKICLADSLRNLGELEEALNLARNTVSQLSDDAPLALQAHSSLAKILWTRNELEAAYEIYGKVLVLAREVYGEYHPEFGNKLSEFGNIASQIGAYKEAEDALRESVAIRRVTHGNDHLLTAASLANLGSSQRLQGAYDDAERSYLESIDIIDRFLPQDAPARANPRLGLGRVRLAKGDFVGAEQPLREALTFRSQAETGSYRVATSKVELGRCLVELGAYEEAELLLSAAEASLAKIDQSRARKMRATALEALIRLNERLSLDDEAERYRDLLAAMRYPT